MKSKAVLSLDDLKKIAAGAEAEANKNNWNVSIAICDDGVICCFTNVWMAPRR